MQAFGYQHKCLLLQNSSADLLQLSLRRDAKLAQLLSGTSIFPQDLTQANAKISPQQWLKLVENCQNHLGDYELAMLTASSMLYNQNLALSRLLQTCSTLKQALKQLYYFRHQLLPLVSISLHRQQQQLCISLLPAIGLGKQQRFVVELVFTLLLQLIRQYQPEAAIQLELALPPPAQQRYYQQHWPYQIHFNQLQHRLLVPLSVLAAPSTNLSLPLPPKAAFTQARFLCRQQRKLLPPTEGILTLIRRQQRRHLPEHCSIELVAASFLISSSTLKRQLNQHQYSFQQLSDEVKNARALHLLQQDKLSNAQLAAQLGYSDEHNFRRAFKRWTGLLPSACKTLLKN